MNMNSGYAGYSMSNRAVEAYDRGERPLSKWTKTAIIDELEALDLCPEYMGRIKKLKKTTLLHYFLCQSSWHHTSKVCNITYFYYIDEEFAAGLDDATMNYIEHHNTEPKKEEQQSQRVSVKFTEWIGHGRYARKHEQTRTGTLCGNVITLDEQSDAGRKTKRADGSHLTYKIIA